jgi:probable HAF family extracellular repeat protein
VVGISAGGEVAGEYFAPTCSPDYPFEHGFLWNEGTFTTIDALECTVFPLVTIVSGISAAGQIIGFFDLEGLQYGFRWTDGSLEIIESPGGPGGPAFPSSINAAGEVVGGYELEFENPLSLHAFKWNGELTTINPPGADVASARLINASGQVVGEFRNIVPGFVLGPPHAFLEENGVVTTIDFPGSTSTSAGGLNNGGEIIGSYTDSSGMTHAFLAKPAVVANGLVHLNSVHTSFDPAPVPGGPAGTFTITSNFTSTSSTPVDEPQFVVKQLSNGNLLLNADLPPGTVGARLTPDVGSDHVLSPGESFDATFVIGLQVRASFTFFVDLLGLPEP